MSLKESYRKHRKAYFIAAGCLVILLGWWAYASAKSKEPKYTTVAVRRGDITAAVQATGTINALTTVSASPDANGVRGR